MLDWASATFVPGTKNLSCAVDPTNAWNESNNSNNSRSTTFTVTV
jgi:subtilase family serine protease